MSDPKPPRSMREFDYFDDNAEPLMGTDTSGASGGLDGQIEAFRRRQKRYFRYVLLTAVTFFVCLSFLYGFKQHAAYAFASPQEPRDLGDVTQMTPRDIPHNSYVTLRGITEHRGLLQGKVHGLALVPDDYWYFRLLGSNGVFIEVPPDKEAYGFVTRVEVSGRAIDPARDDGYDDLIAAYHEKYVSKKRSDLRVIQVGVAPGDGRTPYFIAGLFVLALLASNVIVLMRWIRMRRAGARLR